MKNHVQDANMAGNSRGSSTVVTRCLILGLLISICVSTYFCVTVTMRSALLQEEIAALTTNLSIATRHKSSALRAFMNCKERVNDVQNVIRNISERLRVAREEVNYVSIRQQELKQNNTKLLRDLLLLKDQARTSQNDYKVCLEKLYSSVGDKSPDAGKTGQQQLSDQSQQLSNKLDVGQSASQDQRQTFKDTVEFDRNKESRQLPVNAEMAAHVQKLPDSDVDRQRSYKRLDIQKAAKDLKDDF